MSVPEGEYDYKLQNLFGITRREIIIRPPTKFVVEVIGTQKIDGDFYHGMCIKRSTKDLSPTLTFDSSSDSGYSSDFSFRHSQYSASINSSSHLEEYYLWRAWEECLIFQSVLEQRYSDMAHKKRAALRALSAAHAKSFNSLSKNNRESGLYNTRLQRTASFASLPTGPDPRLIVKDIHHFVPKLTVKGSLFGTNPAVVAKRIDQLTLFIDSLWGKDVVEEDLPRLVLELKEDTEVRDFFAYMAHDHKMAEKYRDVHAENLRKSTGSVLFNVDVDRRSVSSTDTGDYSSETMTTRTRSSLASTWKRMRGKGRNVAEDGNKTFDNHNILVDQRSRSSSLNSVQDPIVEENGVQEAEMFDQEVDTPIQSSFTLQDKSLPPTPRKIHRQSDASTFREINVYDKTGDVAEIYNNAGYFWNDEDVYQAGHLQHRDSVMTFRSFMTTDSANAIVGLVNENNYIGKESKANARLSRSYSFESELGPVAGRHIFTVSSLSVNTLSDSEVARTQNYRVSNASILADDIDTAIRCWESESEDEEVDADAGVELMDGYTFAPLDSPMRFPDSRPVSIFSVLSEDISPPQTPTVSTFRNIY